MKALFMKNLLFKNVDNIMVASQDFLFHERRYLAMTTRNMKEWVEQANNFQTGIVQTAKMIYLQLLRPEEHKPRIEIKFVDVRWKRIWKNTCMNFIPTDWQATAFLVLNDAVANAVKLKKHHISNESPICSACGNVDNNIHRLKLCLGSRIIWMWIANKLWQRLNVNVNDPEELLVKNLKKEEEAGMWFVMAAIHYNFHNFRDGTLNDFLNLIRVSRLLNKEYLERRFGILLRIF
jgi:hypothetical protein